MDTRYPALKTVSALLKGLGCVAVFIGVVALCYSLVGLSQYQGHGSTTDQIGSAAMGGAGLVLSLILILAGVVTIAFGELITVIVDIEQNTRIGLAEEEEPEEEEAEAARIAAHATSNWLFREASRLEKTLDPSAMSRALIYYRGFCQRFPEHPQIKEAQKRIADIEARGFGGCDDA